MRRKRLVLGVAAAGLAAFVGGAGIVGEGSSASAARRPVPRSTTSSSAEPSSTSWSSSTTTASPVVSTTVAATPARPAPTSTTIARPAPTTTIARPAPPTTTTSRPTETTGPSTVAGPGTVQLVELPSGDADGGTREVWVYRPAVPDSPALPVVYLLHGYPGGDRDVDGIGLAGLLDQEFENGAAPFVVAVPNGQSDLKPDTEWADSVDGQVRVESFVVATAIPAVEGANRRDAAHRAIAGFSMGGYGSANLAEHHPDLFGQLVSIAGYYHIDDLSGMGAGTPAWEDAYSPDRHVAALAGTRTLLVVDAEEADPLIRGEGDRFAGLQRSAGQNPVLVIASGNHSWAMVAGQVPTIVAFLDAGWG